MFWPVSECRTCAGKYASACRAAARTWGGFRNEEQVGSCSETRLRSVSVCQSMAAGPGLNQGQGSEVKALPCQTLAPPRIELKDAGGTPLSLHAAEATGLSRETTAADPRPDDRVPHLVLSLSHLTWEHFCMGFRPVCIFCLR